MVAQVLDPGNLWVIDGNSIAGHWTQVMLVPVLLGAIGYLLLQHGVIRSENWTFAGIACIVFAILISLAMVPSDLESIVRVCFFVLAIGGAISFIVAREPVHAALGFATAVLSTCGVLFMEQALFIAAATMIVYAGATIIIFLFVLMFSHQKDLRRYEIQLNNPILAASIGTILLGTIIWSVTSDQEILPIRRDDTRPHSLARNDNRIGNSEVAMQKQIPSSTAALGRTMYTDYLLAIELAGTVLLVATLGAIALAERPTEAKA